MNKVFLIGNLTDDPELRYSNAGIPVCNFSIAVNRRKRADGDHETDFFRITAWRQLGELCGKFLMKGKKVAVSGSIQTRSYNAKDGSRRTALDIIADEVEFLTPMGSAPGTEKPNSAQNEPFTEAPDEELPF